MTRPVASLAGTLLTLLPLLLAGGAGAQEEHPAYSERGSNETLMDRSDLGNVTQRARFLIAEGNRELRRATKLQGKLAAAKEAEREGLGKKIVAARERAVAKFTEAVQLSPKTLGAYAALGGAYGELGKHQERLQVHAAALKIAPDDEANFRGWAGALLELDMLGDATRAWEHFEAADPRRAEILMTEMRSWVERRRADPGSLPAEHIDRMETWLAERG